MPATRRPSLVSFFLPPPGAPGERGVWGACERVASRVAVAAPVEPAARPPAAAPAPGQDPSWGNLISFMEGGGTPSKAPVAKAHYQAAQNAQALALSREDREAEKRAMEMAKQSAFQAEKFAHVSARQVRVGVCV